MRKKTKQELEIALEAKIDERFDLLEKNLKEYIGGYFEDIKKTTNSIQRVQNEDGEHFGKWHIDYFPEIIKDVRAIKASFKRNKDELIKEVSEGVEETVSESVPKAFEAGVENYIENNPVRPKKRKFVNKLFNVIRFKKYGN